MTTRLTEAGYFDLRDKYFLVIYINKFPGDLTDISANKEALVNVSHTVSPLSIQTLCELHRYVASSNDSISSIRRLHPKHLDCAHAVASSLYTILFCISPSTSALKRCCLNT